MSESPKSKQDADRRRDQRLVLLEVALIQTRTYTKIVEASEEVANGICGMIYNQGWTEEEVAKWVNCAAGPITSEKITHVVDTVDVLEHPDSEQNATAQTPPESGTKDHE